MEPVAEGNALVLHLDPRPGPNRANVYVRDAGGALKTIRVSVRVREPAGRPAALTAPSPVGVETEARVEQPVPAEPAATRTVDVTVDEPVPAPPAATPTVNERSGEGRPRWRAPRWWCAPIGLFCVLVGISMVASVGDFVDKYEANYGVSIVLRRHHKGGPLLTELLSGVALAAVGAVSLILLGLRRLPLLAAMRSMVCCLGIPVPWSLFFLGDDAALRSADVGWMLDEVGWTTVTGGLVALAGLASVGLVATGAWTRVSWAPTRVQAALLSRTGASS